MAAVSKLHKGEDSKTVGGKDPNVPAAAGADWAENLKLEKRTKKYEGEQVGMGGARSSAFRKFQKGAKWLTGKNTIGEKRRRNAISKGEVDRDQEGGTLKCCTSWKLFLWLTRERIKEGVREEANFEKEERNV